MDFENYRNFIRIVDKGSMTAAAKNLNIAQPALSMQLKRLEQEYGHKLLQKKEDGRGLVPTPEGKIFYDEALKMCQAEERLQLKLQSNDEVLEGTLRLGIIPSLSTELIRCLKAFRERYPKVNFEIQIIPMQRPPANPTEQEYLLLDHQGLIEYAKTHDIIMKWQFRPYVLYNKENPWFSADLHEISIDQLAQAPLAISNIYYGMNLRRLIELQGYTPNVVAVLDYRLGFIDIARENMAACVVMDNTDAPLLPDLRFVPLKGAPIFFHVLGKPHGEQLSPLSKIFINFFKDVFLPHIYHQ